MDAPETQRKFRKYFYITLCALLIIDLSAFFLFKRHGHFPWEEVPFFNAVYGFTACVSLIFIAKILRWIVKRKEDYYD
ncbi:MAG: hypothetical protein GY860_23635 [Desulfobacteraceae bacterium]|nr:hypothetical protein [Desulfobacteraceae bacterium]